MTNTDKKAVKIRWAAVAFLLSTAILGFIGAPLHAWKYGISTSEIVLFIFFSFTTIMAISLGYHRLYAHASFKAGKLTQFLILFFGAAAFEQSAYRWASLHRTHHLHVDTDRDPYNIKRGFFYAHMGWLIFKKPVMEFENVADLLKNPLVAHQHKHFQKWGLTAGLILPIALGFAVGHPVGVFLWAVAARIALVHHSTFFINSFAHTFGTSQFDAYSSAKDNWIGALLTNGEGYHNYHHRFPSDYRNGYRWYHWDPTKWAIWSLSRARLVSDLKKTLPAKIDEAKAVTLAAKKALA
jgi:stearoyl-CoA desaturase (delta-9 desaturase)